MARSRGSIHIVDNSIVSINDAIQQLLFLIDELRGEHNNTTIPVGPHTHAGLTGPQGAPGQDGGLINIPAQNINHDDLINVTSDQHHNKLHSSTHGPGGVDALKLDDLAAPDDNTDLNASITAHGLLLKLSGSSADSLKGDGTWAPASAATLEVKEEDGAPDVIGVSQIKFPDGSLTDNGSGSVSVSFAGVTSTEAKDVEDIEGCLTTPIWELINTGPGLNMTEGLDHDGVQLDTLPNKQYCIESDDFLSGSTTSLQIGKLGWGASGGYSIIASEANHPGISRMSSSGAVAMFLNNSNVGVLHTGDLFDVSFLVRPDTTSAATYRFGFFNNQASTSNPPTDGIYFEYIGGTDSFWNGVCRSGSSTTKSPTAVAPGASTWATLRIRRHNSTTIAFSVDGGTEIFISATVPSEAAVLVMQVIPSSGTHTFDIDWMSLLVNVSR